MFWTSYLSDTKLFFSLILQYIPTTIAQRSFTSLFSYYKEIRLWQRGELLSYPVCVNVLQENWNFHDQEIRAKTKQNKNNETKCFWGYKNVNFFFECIQNITSDPKAICFVIFARKGFISLNFRHYKITSSRSLTPLVTEGVTDLE